MTGKGATMRMDTRTGGDREAGRGRGSKTVLSVLFMTVFLDFLGFSIVLPYLYFQAESLGADDFAYGLLLTSFSLMQLIFVWVFGRLSDRLGRRRILLASLFGSGVSFVIFGLANSLWLLFAARIVGGIMDSTFSVAQAYVADITSGRDRLKQMGLMGAGIGLGFTVGPAVGGILSTLYGYAAPSLLAAALAFANLALAYVRLPESRPAVKSERKAPAFRAFLRTVATREALVYLLVATFTGNLAFVFMDVTMAPWLQVAYGYGPLEAGLIFLYVSVVNVVTQAAVLPRMGKRYSPATLLALGLAVTTLAFLGFGLVVYLPAAIVLGGLLMFGTGLVNPSLSHLISVNAGKGEQGGILGLGQSVGSLARVIAPSLAVSVFTLGLSWGAVGTVFLAAAAVNTIPFVLVFARRNGLQPARSGPEDAASRPSVPGATTAIATAEEIL